MSPMPKAAFSPRSITAAVGVALALALTGCGGQGTDETPKKSDEAAQTEESGDDNGMQGQAASTEDPSQTAPAKSEPSETKSEDPFADAPKTTSWASDDAMKVNKDGDGNIPAASIEADLDDLFTNKFDMKLTRVECRDDMKVMDWWGLTSCEVETKKKTYFGSMTLVDHKDNMIKYEIKFPGLDKTEVDF